MLEDIDIKIGRLVPTHTGHLYATLIVGEGVWQALSKLSPTASFMACDALRIWLKEAPTESEASVSFNLAGRAKPEVLSLYQAPSLRESPVGCRAIITALNGSPHSPKPFNAKALAENLATATQALHRHGKTTREAAKASYRWVFVPNKQKPLIVI